MIITGQGYLPVDVIGEQVWFDSCREAYPAGEKRRTGDQDLLRILEEGQFRVLYRGVCGDAERGVCVKAYSSVVSILNKLI